MFTGTGPIRRWELNVVFFCESAKALAVNISYVQKAELGSQVYYVITAHSFSSLIFRLPGKNKIQKL